MERAAVRVLLPEVRRVHEVRVVRAVRAVKVYKLPGLCHGLGWLHLRMRSGGIWTVRPDDPGSMAHVWLTSIISKRRR